MLFEHLDRSMLKNTTIFTNRICGCLATFWTHTDCNNDPIECGSALCHWIGLDSNINYYWNRNTYV